MITFETSILINRPQQEVFDFVADPANNPQWQGTIESSEWTSEGPIAVGSTQNVVTRFLGRKIESTMELTAWDSPNQYSFKTASGPIPFEGTNRFESKENGTQVTVAGKAEPGGFFKLTGGLFAKQLQKQIETDLSALKLMLEAGAE